VPKRQNEGGFTRIQEIWVASGTLSETLDNVGSQKAKVIETIGADPATPSGYSLASKQESNFEGLQTNRFTFLKPSILSLRQELSGGSKQVSVQAFGLDEADVIAALSEVTSDHVLLSQSESDYAGIKTTTFEFRLDESFTEDYELNGLQRISLVELSVSNFTAQTIGSVSSSAPTTGLYLGTQKIDNGGSIKTRESVWLEAGTLRVRRNDIGQGRFQVQTTFLITEGSTVGPITSKDIQNFEGLKTIVVTTLQDKDGNSIANGGSNLILEHEVEVDFRYPGEVSIGEDTGTVDIGTTEVNFTNYYYSLRPPVSNPIEATRYVIYQTSNEIVAGDLVYDGAQGRWKPDDWAIGTIEGLEAIFSGDYSQLNSIRGGGSTRVFSNYTAVAPLSESGTAGWTYDTTDPNNPVVTVFTAEGQNKIGPWSISVSGGPTRS
jgi:hypothetical protein